MLFAVTSNLSAAGEFLSKQSGIFFSALTGTFLGAVSAYWTERIKEKRKHDAEDFGAMVRTQMVLVGQLNTVENLRKQYLELFRNDPNREHNLILFQMTETTLRVPYEGISFLLTKGHPNLVLEIHAAEQSYFSAIEALAARNRAYEQLHKNSKLETIDPKTGRCTVRIEDPRDIKLLKDMTNSLYVAVDRACERLDAEIKALYDTGKNIFPKKKFLRIAGEKDSKTN